MSWRPAGGSGPDHRYSGRCVLARLAWLIFQVTLTVPRPIETAPCDGTLVRFWCRSAVEPIVGYWSRRFIGWCSYVEARAMPLRKVRQRNRKAALVVGH
jgi:hypothetical protein